jgi:hypothetical protein
MTSRSNAGSGRFGLLDVVVLIAMAVAATALPPDSSSIQA